MRWFAVTMLCSCALLFAHAVQAQTNDVKLSAVKFAELEKQLNSFRGKCVVVYIWGDYSVPDRAMIPAVVNLQQRYANKPIVFVAVCHSGFCSPDHRKDWERQQARNLEFLRKHKVRLKNFVLEEDDEDIWTEKLGFISGPTFNVYDRRGDKVKTFRPVDKPYTLSDVELLVKQLIRRGG